MCSAVSYGATITAGDIPLNQSLYDSSDPYAIELAQTNAAAISALNTNRTTRLWSSTTNFMDGSGMFYEISVNTRDFVCTSVSDSDLTTFLGEIWTLLDTQYYNSRGLVEWVGWAWYFSDYITYEDFWDYTHPVDADTLSLVGPSGTITLTKGYSITNVIDSSVTTNGTVIIIGHQSDSSGYTTNLLARSGDSTLNIPFFGKSESDAAIAQLPTNYVAGILLPDSGTNVTYTLIVTNGLLSLWEVL